MKRTKTVVSVTHSELLVVQKNSVLLLVNEFPKILTSYRRFKQKCENGDLMSVGVLCECCQQFGHAVGDCPQIQSSMRPADDLLRKSLMQAAANIEVDQYRESASVRNSMASYRGYDNFEALSRSTSAKFMPPVGVQDPSRWLEIRDRSSPSTQSSVLMSDRGSGGAFRSVDHRFSGGSGESARAAREVSRGASGRFSSRASQAGAVIRSLSNRTMSVLKVPSLRSLGSQTSGQEEDPPGVVKSISYNKSATG
mmetsp:Transcript_142575/g.259221  ORF Transcript_142575/g.259221 Transcript_142575/m.259221 type:complete len:253 (-) Transcript_142575:18-776(-)